MVGTQDETHQRNIEIHQIVHQSRIFGKAKTISQIDITPTDSKVNFKIRNLKLQSPLSASFNHFLFFLCPSTEN